MNKKLINYLGLTGIISLLSYTTAVLVAPRAYPGYDWMSQAVSDLSAIGAPSRNLWAQLATPYDVCGIVCATCVCIFVSEHDAFSKLFRRGIYLFGLMNWVSSIGYGMFPLSEAGTGTGAFQDVMHVYVVTTLVVVLSIVSLSLLIVAGWKEKSVRNIGLWAAVALAMMFVGAIGKGIVPRQYFGIVERFSVFAAVGFNAVLGVHLSRGFTQSHKRSAGVS